MPENPSKGSRAMQIVSVRFGADQIELIQQEAGDTGVSASQFIRDSAYARAVLGAAKRNRASLELWENLIAVVETVGYDGLSASMRELLAAAEAEDHHAT